MWSLIRIAICRDSVTLYNNPYLLKGICNIHYAYITCFCVPYCVPYSLANTNRYGRCKMKVSRIYAVYVAPYRPLSRARYYYVNAFRKVCKYTTRGGRYGRLDPFSGLPKGSRTCFDQSFLHGSLVKVRRRMPFRD